ncbi:MAG TPA: isoprenylcysteine carboxylmethyltransferase family protein [Steroidobacteraceae bacterium]|nr:isoprenylcysteine carboxylmethyltransferase family protein [Steroidobacteraceae bacterium]
MNALTRRVLPPVWLLLALAASFALDRWWPIARLVPAPWNYLGYLPLALGAFMAITAANAFRRAGTPVVPFERSTVLVTSGWFRLTRNPMYVGLTLILLGAALIDGTLGAFLPLPVFVGILHFRFVLDEEAFLESIFGEKYRRYRSAVRRWI